MKQCKVALWALLSCFLVSACGLSPPEQLPQSSLASSGSGLGASNASPITDSANGSLGVYASSTNVSPGGSTQFSASGGTPPYSYINLSGLGSLNPDTGAYVAPATADSITVEAIDAVGDTASTTITVGTNGTTNGSALSVNASATSIVPGNTVTFTVTGGTAPYAYAIYGGYGALSASGESYVTSTVYTSSTLDNGSVTLQVTDSNGNEVESIVSFTIPPTTTIAVNVYQSGAQSCGNTPCYLNPDFATATEACNANGYPTLISFTIMSQYQSQPNEPGNYYTGNRYWWTGFGWAYHWDGQCNTGGGCSGPGYIIQNVTCQ